ncbi:N-acetylmuramoyl-L-alanine amidase [Mucilaginibacter sp. 44-25]|uniref:N-acetylmuramoyl-L-alanine amidase n=1 Tax=Mucilaginibacter sp. 44-25 TaxID=1895794 RepID=UPI000961660C|nr:N-acetylmuramoyl-L-alanine amidase [Mucilaginibacter sp. 44-25]OJW17248.1 MAG: N-acetylmuramoyl-L-alanine amidase [Mucilaginibacter sp. 44-25]
MKKSCLLLLFIPLFFSACSSKKKIVKTISAFDATNQVYTSHADSLSKVLLITQAAMLTDSLGSPVPSEFVGTVNFNLRKPNYVIIHYTAQDSVTQTLRTFTLVRTQVSAHYVVGKDGRVIHMLNDYMRAWHAGISKWGSVTDMNSCSIGIELDNNGYEPFSQQQISSLLLLLAKLKRDYNIPTANFIGHADIAPGRKPDPGIRFPWEQLAKKGFGYYSDMLIVPAPVNFDSATALRLIGYDTSNLPAAISAFKRHFVQREDSPVFTPFDLDVLYNVYKKY